MNAKVLFSILKETFFSWNEHDAPRLGAALAFYTILSLSPLIILVLAIAGLVFDQSTAQTQFLSQVQAMIGAEGAKAIGAMLTNAHRPAAGMLGTFIGLASLCFGASGVFGELRSALNVIWDVTPSSSGGIVGAIRERFFSFGMVLSIGFLLMVSLVVSTVLAALGKYFAGILPAPAAVLIVFNFLVSFLGIAILFGLIFRFVPAAPSEMIRWKNIWLGSLVTALFFTVGKTLIGLYLGKASVGSSYGAAGSVIVLIVWVYYSAQLFYLGAEFTHAYAKHQVDSPSSKNNSAVKHNKAA
jgi:membrane protein